MKVRSHGMILNEQHLTKLILNIPNWP